MQNVPLSNVSAQQVSENFPAPGSTIRSQRNTCFSRRHLPPAVQAFYEYALALARTSGVFWSNARRDAWEFGVGKDAVTRWQGRLEKDGWIIRLDRGPRLKRSKATGMYAAIRYRVLTHDEWAAAHPGRCRFPPTESVISEPVPKIGTGQTTPRVFDASPVPISDSTCPCFDAPPVLTIGTKVCIKTEVLRDRASLTSTSPAASLRAAGRDDDSVAELYDKAFRLHWKRNDVLAMIEERYGVTKVGDLNQAQFEEALGVIACGPSAWEKA